ncbi:MAG: phytoene desaturase family protein [Brevinematia bacterium]
MGKIVVIGGGFGGLSIAALLGKDGHNVTLIEKNNSLGGRARVMKEMGFVYDMGPSWYLMPEVFERFFSLFNKKVSDFYELKRLDPYYRIFFENEGYVDVYPDREKILELFRQFEENGDKKIESYLKNANYKYDIAMKNFLYRDFKNIFSFFNFRMLTEGLKLDVFKNLDKVISKYFTSHKSKKILEYEVVFLGNSPYNAPSLYSILSHVDLNLGVWYPMGGMGKIVDALEKLCKDNGVKIITGEEVINFKYENNKISEVITNGGNYKADYVISSADYAHTELKILDDSHRTFDKKYWGKRVMAPSMFIIYLGVNKKLKNLKHHNLYFSRDWNKHFETIFEEPKYPDNPCFYISCPSYTDPSVAESDKENLFILVPVSCDIKDENVLREDYFDYLIKHIENIIGENFKDDIIYKRIFSINDFANDYNAFKGTALGLAHTLFQTAVFRPPHKSKKVKNLYYTGHYTHPGVGVPMTLIASEIVYNEFKEIYG